MAHHDGGVTPGFSRTYRRDGSPLPVTDAAGTRTIAYGNAGGARPSGESYAGGLLDGAGLAWPETLGRRTAFVATAALRRGYASFNREFWTPMTLFARDRSGGEARPGVFLFTTFFWIRYNDPA